MSKRFDRADGIGPRCPVCDSIRNEVVDTRRHKGRIFRRRRCKCGEKFATVEMPIDTTLWGAISGREQWSPVCEAAQ